MTVVPIRTQIFREGENLCAFIKKHIPRLKERSVLVVTSKIVALSEGRTAENTPSERERLIKVESDFAMRTPHTWLTIKDGTVMASAGIDESNADGKLILLPRDSFATAVAVREYVRITYGVDECGVLITDSRLLPLRAGVVGIALGYAGFGGIRDYRGTPDLFGRPLAVTRTDIADSLATAAVLAMGEGNECQPLAVIADARIAFTDEKPDRQELAIHPREDVYAPLFTHMRY